MSVCKAEGGSVAVATVTDDNEADGKIGSAIYHELQVVSTLVNMLKTSTIHTLHLLTTF